MGWFWSNHCENFISRALNHNWRWWLHYTDSGLHDITIEEMWQTSHTIFVLMSSSLTTHVCLYLQPGTLAIFRFFLWFYGIEKDGTLTVPWVGKVTNASSNSLEFPWWSSGWDSHYWCIGLSLIPRQELDLTCHNQEPTCHNKDSVMPNK